MGTVSVAFAVHLGSHARLLRVWCHAWWFTCTGNAQFVRFARETPRLLDDQFRMGDVDIVWAKCKSLGQRRMNFDQFLEALMMIAWAKFPRHGASTLVSV